MAPSAVHLYDPLRAVLQRHFKAIQITGNHSFGFFMENQLYSVILLFHFMNDFLCPILGIGIDHRVNIKIIVGKLHDFRQNCLHRRLFICHRHHYNCFFHLSTSKFRLNRLTVFIRQYPACYLCIKRSASLIANETTTSEL